MEKQFLNHLQLGFIGGGNMASAVIGGLLRNGMANHQVRIIEPFSATRSKLKTDFDIEALPQADASLQKCNLIVWAVKPQLFKEATMPCVPFTKDALHLSVAAGVTSHSIASWLGTDRIVRAMPNTPALVGMGMTGLFARAAVSRKDKDMIDHVIRVTGKSLWFDEESKLDAVTALSGSGPAYVFYFLEAMVEAGVKMGLEEAQARMLATATFNGATTLATASTEPLYTLRERVTSKGGTTYAALMHMEAQGVKASFVAAMEAAQIRAKELGAEFG